MKLITPDFGLLFWTALVFISLMFLLTKFAFKPILGMVNAREQKISEALELAEKTRTEMKLLAAQNEQLLMQARAERDEMIKDAKEVATRMVEDAKTKASEAAEKVMSSSMQAFEAEKTAVISELKTQMASFSLEIAEKVIRGELANDDKQKALAESLASDINLN